MEHEDYPWDHPEFRAALKRGGFGLRVAVGEWTRPSPGGDGLLISAFRVLDIWRLPNPSLPAGTYDQLWLRGDLRRDGVMAWTSARAGRDGPPTGTQPAAGWTLPAMRTRLAETQAKLLDKPNTKLLPSRDHRQRFADLRAEYHRLRLGREWGGLEDDDRLRLLARVLVQDSRGPAAVLAAQGLQPADDVATFAALARKWERAARRA